MYKKEKLTKLINRKEEKKVYNTPKIEDIASVRKVTRGSTLGQNDSGGQTGPVPSDPG